MQILYKNLDWSCTHTQCAYGSSLGLCGPRLLCQECLRLTTVDWCHLQPVRDHPTGFRCLQGQECGFVLPKSRAAWHVCLYSEGFSRINPPFKSKFCQSTWRLSAERVASPIRDPASRPPAPLKTSRAACDIAEYLGSLTYRKACYDHTLTNKGKQRDRRDVHLGARSHTCSKAFMLSINRVFSKQELHELVIIVCSSSQLTISIAPGLRPGIDTGLQVRSQDEVECLGRPEAYRAEAQ